MVEPLRVLVTGGAGFIGSHVVDALVAQGHAVAVIDSLSSGDWANVNAAATFYQADITDVGAVDRVFAEFRPQIVDHHAAQISVAVSTRDPGEDARVNVIGSLAVMEACKAHGVEHLVFASTGGALYGESDKLPADEDTPVLPLSPYGAAKASVETYLRTFRATWGLSYTALRYANVYGPRQTPDGEAGVIAIFAGKMLSGAAPTIFGDGEYERDYVYIGDIARANALAVDHRPAGSYNVGTGIGTNVNEIAASLAELCGYTGKIEHAAAREGDVRRSTLDSSLIDRTVGWRPEVSLDEGLRLTVEHHRGLLDVTP